MNANRMLSTVLLAAAVVGLSACDECSPTDFDHCDGDVVVHCSEPGGAEGMAIGANSIERYDCSESGRVCRSGTRTYGEKTFQIASCVLPIGCRADACSGSTRQLCDEDLGHVSSEQACGASQTCTLDAEGATWCIEPSYTACERDRCDAANRALHCNVELGLVREVEDCGANGSICFQGRCAFLDRWCPANTRSYCDPGRDGFFDGCGSGDDHPSSYTPCSPGRCEELTMGNDVVVAQCRS